MKKCPDRLLTCLNLAKSKIKLVLDNILIDLQAQLCRPNDFDRVGESI